MQFFDLRNLNYYCDAKGHLEQPVFFKLLFLKLVFKIDLISRRTIRENF